MSKSKLREEYEARFSVVEGSLKLFDADGNMIYCEDSSGYWVKYEFDANNNEIYYENSSSWWVKREYDDNGNVTYLTYYETSGGDWTKQQYDDNNNVIYGTDNDGLIEDNRTCSDKVFIDEQSGKKFKLMEIK
tara:strand:+ start:291 stop:689 length:399 start_codon:yes stop_codon:yes gene_type:complete